MGADDNRAMTASALSDGALQGALRLHTLGVIRAGGADAATFLHGQLTNDILQLGPDEARLAGYCSAKGRLVASFMVWRCGADLLLACSADLLAPTLRRLRMFVLRAKCSLSDASAELPVFGLAGAAAQHWLGDSAPGRPGETAQRGAATVVRLSDAAGVPRFLCTGLDAPPPLPALDPGAWDWLEVRSGVARIVAATTERFVPQMLNYELVGGVDFRKGCYPGQEVVARSQYRGTIKRRSLLFELAGPPPAPGSEVFHTDDPGQPAGAVVLAAAGPREGASAHSLALVEIKLAALASGGLHLGSPEGLALIAVDMPYEVPREATADA